MKDQTSLMKRMLLCLVFVTGFAAQPGWAAAPEAGQAGKASEKAALPLFTLSDQTGESFGTAQTRGQVAVFNFVRSQCRTGCASSMPAMLELQKRLSGGSDGVWLVSISVDPVVDTPEVLAGYARELGVTQDNWKFLTGSRSQIRRLLTQGFRLPAGKDTAGSAPLLDSGQLVVVDKRGWVRARYEGTSSARIPDLETTIAGLAAEQVEYAPGAHPGIDASGAAIYADPPEIFDPTWLDGLKAAQLATLEDFRVFHDFAFADQRERSGITFRHKVTDDNAIAMKAVHYDHGNGLPIADVDGDGLYDLYFVNQVGANELWRNLGGGRFQDITETAGVGLPRTISVTASFADIDNDGDPDLYVTTVRQGNHLFENDGKGQFRDISEESGLNYSGHSSSPVFFDYDRDGLLDVFLSNVGKYTGEKRVPITPLFPEFEKDSEISYWVGYLDAFSGHLFPERDEISLLFHNEGGNRFKDVTEEVGLYDISWTGDSSPLDYNNDGWPDLYVINMQGDDELYENVEGKKFIVKSKRVFPKTPFGSMGIKVFDYNNDGQMDIYITDMHSDMMGNTPPELDKTKWPEEIRKRGDHNLFGNALFQNQGDGTFKEVSEETNAENYWPWGLSVGDLNADGWDDAFIASSMNLPFRYGVNSLLLNQRGERFMDSEFILDIEPRKGETEILWYEVQCPERGPDEVPLQKGYGDHYINTVCENKSGRVMVWTAKGSRSSAIFDIDDDGDLDIVTSEFNDMPQVLVSNLAERKPDLRYLKIRLIGTRSNRDGLGARVTVTTAAGSYTKVHDGKSGYLSQSSYPLYFGLGKTGMVDQIEITWPSGKTQTLAGPIETNKLLEIKEN